MGGCRGCVKSSTLSSTGRHHLVIAIGKCARFALFDPPLRTRLPANQRCVVSLAAQHAVGSWSPPSTNPDGGSPSHITGTPADSVCLGAAGAAGSRAHDIPCRPRVPITSWLRCPIVCAEASCSSPLPATGQLAGPLGGCLCGGKHKVSVGGQRS